MAPGNGVPPLAGRAYSQLNRLVLVAAVKSRTPDWITVVLTPSMLALADWLMRPQPTRKVSVDSAKASTSAPRASKLRVR